MSKTRVKRDAVKYSAERELEKQTAQLKRYRRYLTALREKLKAGPNGEHLRLVLAFLRHLEIEKPDDLLKILDSHAWFQTADEEMRYEVLRSIDNAVERLRVQHGLAPFDDSMPFTDEPPTVFETCRSKLGVMKP
jgi:hypothetical protein